MKKLFYLMLVVLSTTTQAQEITELKEAIIIAPNARQVLNGESDLTFTISENYYGEFSKDPIAFMKANFNIREFIDFTSDMKYDAYLVTFKSEKGRLEVDFDKNGRLKRNRQSFNDVVLPIQIQQEIHRNHPDWNMETNKFYSKGKGESTDKIVYRIKLNNGDKVRRIRLVPQLKEELVVAEK